jgi:hypothetical protein
MIDHMSNGRLIFGISPGGLQSDAEVFGNLDKDRTAMFARAPSGRANLFKADQTAPGSTVTPQSVVDQVVIWGTIEKVVDDLLAFREEIGDFGTLIYASHDFAAKRLGRRWMELMVEKVMPAINSYTAAASEGSMSGASLEEGHGGSTTESGRLRRRPHAAIRSAVSTGSDRGRPSRAERSIAMVRIRLRWPSAAVACGVAWPV